MIAPLTIIRRPVKHARLRVREDSSVQLIVPDGFEQSLIDSLLLKKATWIARHQQFFCNRVADRRTLAANEIQLFGEVFRFVHCPELGQKVVVDEDAKEIHAGRNFALKTELNRWYRAYARDILRQQLQELCATHRLPFKRCFIRSQRTRWGTCSVKGNVSLNWRLILAPKYVAEYVVLHELMHTKVLNHSQRFWVQLRAICPRCKEAIQWLNANPPSELVGRH
jgi:predicted metal-dependent hydrolase